jgi:hypothetical protein
MSATPVNTSKVIDTAKNCINWSGRPDSRMPMPMSGSPVASIRPAELSDVEIIAQRLADEQRNDDEWIELTPDEPPDVERDDE